MPKPKPENLPRKSRKKKKRTTIFSCLTRKKSMMPSRAESMVRLRQVYSDFCQETTLHGLKHTVAGNFHWFERLLWFALTVLAFCGAVYCALSQFNRYSSEPVVVSLQRDYTNWWTTFPALTTCFLERVDPELVKKAIEKHWNLTEDLDPEKFQYYADFVQLVADVSFRSNLQNFWKYQTDDSVQDIDLRELAVSVHPNHTLKVVRSMGGDELQWVPILTEDGLCFTYNSEYAVYQYALKGSPSKVDQLLKCHYHSGECFVKVESTTPVRFFIHSPYDISTAISNPTGEMSPGEELLMDFKAVEIRAAPDVKGLRHEQRRCHYPDEWLTSNIRAYSFGLCQMHCRTRMALMFCNCRPFFFVKGASLGGTTALFVGASVLTVVETILFILRKLIALIFDRKSPVMPFNP